MDKLNITSGGWKVKKWDGEQWPEKRISIGQKDDNKFCVAISPKYGDSKQVQRDFEAIVTAVNSTYKRGIDPEAVPDMLEALEDCVDFINWCNGDGFTSEDWDKLHVVINKAEQALKKAEL